MTPTDSVRVPHETLGRIIGAARKRIEGADACHTQQWRDGGLTAIRFIEERLHRLFAAPAPAGARKPSELTFTTPPQTLEELRAELNAGAWKEPAMDAELRELCERLRGLHEKATQGPLTRCGQERGGCSCGMVFSQEADSFVADFSLSGDEETRSQRPDAETRKTNAALYAEAVNALPRLLDTIAAQAAEWRPIETAPKSGHTIWLAGEGCMRLGWWCNAQERWIDHAAAEANEPVRGLRFAPLRWHPIPAMPALADSGAGVGREGLRCSRMGRQTAPVDDFADAQRDDAARDRDDDGGDRISPARNDRQAMGALLPQRHADRSRDRDHRHPHGGRRCVRT